MGILSSCIKAIVSMRIYGDGENGRAGQIDCRLIIIMFAIYT